MTDQQIQNKIDNFWGPNKVAQFTSLQADFKTTHSKYFQGILTPPTLPVDGADVDPIYTLHPSDQAQDWGVFLGTTAFGKMPSSIEIFYHKGPNGEGFTIIVKYQNAQGEIWQRKFGTGAYGETIPWAIVPQTIG